MFLIEQWIHYSMETFISNNRWKHSYQTTEKKHLKTDSMQNQSWSKPRPEARQICGFKTKIVIVRHNSNSQGGKDLYASPFK